MGCPLCGEEFASLAELEAHADSHFSQPTPSSRPAATGLRRCGACGAAVAPEEFASHQLAHKLEEEELAAADSAAASRALTEELDAQGAAQAAAEEWGDGGGGSDDEDALHTAQLEELYFEQLKARYGFSVPQRSGCCRLCGRDGHWAADCEQNPDRKAAAQRVLDPPLPPRIVATQQQGEATRMRGTAGLVQLLAAALEGQQAPPSQEYAAALCGDVQHFGASHFTSGWGCGWNNMQMLASHLLATRADARAALFGGAGFVPDISALQAWLEAAWRAGFDPQGAEQLAGQVQGTKKWVGTTECAALLRSFGVRAQVVDFGVNRAQATATQPGPHARQPAATQPVHPGVQCDGCGVCPVVGHRFRSERLADYDLCGACHAQPWAAAKGPYRRMMPGAVRLPSQQQQQQAAGSNDGSVREQLLRWVWRYFVGSCDACQQGGQRCTCGSAGAQAGAATGPHNPKRARRSHVRLSGKPPLYFQHEGHSRTIIGIERRLMGRERRPQYGLLVLDPGTPGAGLANALHSGAGWQRLLRRGAHTLKHPQYQLLFVQPGLASGAELQSLKQIAAVERYS